MSERVRTPVDASAVREHKSIESIIGEYVKLQRDGQEYKACCPFHKEKTPSFHVVPSKGFYHCFGCGEHGDGIDFVMKHAPLPTRRQRNATPTVDIYAPYLPICPVPADAPPIVAGKRTPMIFNPKREEDPKKRESTYTPSMVHPYRDASGQLIGYVIRQPLGLDKNGKPGKITPSVMFCQMPDGSRQWCLHPFPEPRPIYGADLLAEDEFTPWLAVEGEKAADALRARFANLLMPPYIVITWQGGGKAPKHTDWSLIANRPGVIWPDADEEGAKTKDDLLFRAQSLGCSVSVVDTSGLPHQFDAADLSPDDDAEAFIASRIATAAPASPHDDIPLPDPHHEDLIPDHEPVGLEPVRDAIERIPSRREIETAIGLVNASTTSSEILRIADDIATARLDAVDTKAFSDRLAEQSGRSIKREVSARIKDRQRFLSSRHRDEVTSDTDIAKRYVFVKPLDRFWM